MDRLEMLRSLHEKNQEKKEDEGFSVRPRVADTRKTRRSFSFGKNSPDKQIPKKNVNVKKSTEKETLNSAGGPIMNEKKPSENFMASRSDVENGIAIKPELMPTEEPSMLGESVEIRRMDSSDLQQRLNPELLKSARLCGSLAKELHTSAVDLLSKEDVRPVSDRTDQVVKLAFAAAGLIKTQVEIARSLKD